MPQCTYQSLGCQPFLYAFFLKSQFLSSETDLFSFCPRSAVKSHGISCTKYSDENESQTPLILQHSRGEPELQSGLRPESTQSLTFQLAGNSIDASKKCPSLKGSPHGGIKPVADKSRVLGAFITYCGDSCLNCQTGALSFRTAFQGGGYPNF